MKEEIEIRILCMNENIGYSEFFFLPVLVAGCPFDDNVLFS
jgi:hypothetical protein